MIYGTYAEVACDNCHESVYVLLLYGDEESSVETSLVEEVEWLVVEGKHFCCVECAMEAK